MDESNSYTWYALYTKSRAEKRALEQLESLNIEAYLPLRKSLKQWSDRKKWVEEPIIGSYIFVRICPKDYRQVFEANSIVAYVSYKGKACKIPDSDIEAMRLCIENNLDFGVENATIEKGQLITVTSGPLKGIKGEVVNIKGTRKLSLRISNIGYTLIIDLAEASIAKA